MSEYLTQHPMTQQSGPSFIVVGIPDVAKYEPSEDVRRLIRETRVMSGAARHHEAVRHLLDGMDVRWIAVEVPLADTFRQYAGTNEPILVFASGDPLFFGIANTLRREFPEAPLRVIPYFNSIQQLCHTINLRYDDLTYVSLTGRPWHEFDAALINRICKIGVLTDRTHTPAAIARRMLDYGYTQYIMYVGTRLGHTEKGEVRRLTLEEASIGQFDMPNCVVLEAIAPLTPKPFGIPDSDFALLNGRQRMITKAPIRLLTLRELNLSAATTLWDIGFCTGSISIEARLQFPHVKVYSFEIRPEGKELMEVNSHRFGAPGITAIIEDFTTVDTTELPAPDTIFIGGYGGRLHEVMNKASLSLRTGGRMVINAVSDESRERFVATAIDLGLKIINSMTVTVDSYHPITIITAQK